ASAVSAAGLRSVCRSTCAAGLSA
ncbi:hypothetical protein AZ008_000815, partial [Klebsiella pneumoniae]